MVKAARRSASQQALLLERLRFQSWNGNTLLMHRSLHFLNFKKFDITVLIGIPVISNLLLAYFWMDVQLFFMGAMYFFLHPIVNDLMFGLQQLPLLEKQLYIPLIDSFSPSSRDWWSGFFFAGIMIILAHWDYKYWIPVRYTLGFFGYLQLSANFFFAFNIDGGQQSSLDYLSDAMTASTYWLWISPWVFSIIFNIFPFPLIHKIRISALCSVFLIISFPVQYAFQAFILHYYSSIWIPILFFVASVPLNILASVCFYAMGMAWPTQTLQRSKT